MRFACMQWGNRESKSQTPKLCWKLPTASFNACGKRNERVASALRHLWAIWSTSSECRRHLCITMAMMNPQQLLIGENWAFEVAVYFDSVQVSAPCKIFSPHHLRLFWYKVDGPYLVTLWCLRPDNTRMCVIVSMLESGECTGLDPWKFNLRYGKLRESVDQGTGLLKVHKLKRCFFNWTRLLLLCQTVLSLHNLSFSSSL